MKENPKERKRRVLAAAILHKLKELGWSQARLAAVAGVSTKHLNDVLKGRRYGGDVFKEKVAAALGMTPGELEVLGERLLGYKPPEPEPFPGFHEVMALPVKERYFKVFQLAANHAGFEGAIVHALGDPIFKDRVPQLETEEDVIAAYKEYKTFWDAKAEQLLSTPGIDEERRKAAKRYLEEKFGVKIRLEDLEKLEEDEE